MFARLPHPHFLTAALCTALAGCGESPPPPPLTGAASDVFTEVSRVTLDDSPIATIGKLRAVLPLPDRLLVADGMSDRVLSFTKDGRFQRAVGRRGDAPGEFRNPLSLLRDTDGSILVADVSPRLTRLSPDLQVLDVYHVDVPHYIAHLARIGRDVFLTMGTSMSPGDDFVAWSPDRGMGQSFDPRSRLVQTVPYWNAAWTTLIAVGRKSLFVADNMVYPIRRYTLDRALVDSVGYAPPSWRQATKLKRGQFATLEGQREAQGWLRSFTVIDGLYTVGDDWLVVTHREPVDQYESDDVIRADVYRVDSMRKVWQDVLLPGPVVRGGGDCVWVVTARPPDPWTLACWTPKMPEETS